MEFSASFKYIRNRVVTLLLYIESGIELDCIQTCCLFLMVVVTILCNSVSYTFVSSTLMIILIMCSSLLKIRNEFDVTSRFCLLYKVFKLTGHPGATSLNKLVIQRFWNRCWQPWSNQDFKKRTRSYVWLILCSNHRIRFI